MSAARIPVIGIIGGIGSGKTAVANAIGEFVRVFRLDADVIGHQVLKIETVKNALSEQFGSSIFDDSGEILRPKLASLVFGQAEQQRQSRRQLEAIVHPEIRRQITIQLKEIQDRQACDVIILDAALLLESGWASTCDAIVFLEVAEELRWERVKQRGWTRSHFEDREASQLPLNEKRSRAHFIISNEGDLPSAAKRFVDWFQQQPFTLQKQASTHT